MTPRQVAFALIVTLAAMIWAAWDRIVYEWETVPEWWQVVWAFLAAILLTSLGVWVAYPFMKQLM